MFKANVYVTLKKNVVDPQGSTIKNALAALGHEELQEVRVGKFIELWVNKGSESSARRQVEKMCEQLLANPVIEDYRVEMVEVETEGDDE